MHRIDTPNAQKDKFGVGKNGFTNGNPQTGELATELNADYFDSVQEEMCNVIEGAGLTLDKAKTNQLQMALGLIGSMQGVIAKNGYVSIPVNISGVISELLVQWGAGEINAHSGVVSFPKAYTTTPFVVIPTKIAYNNRYVNAVNYTKTGFEINGFISSGDGNVDSYAYISIGW